MDSVQALLALLGMTWVAASFYLKLRDKIDDIRNNIVFQANPTIRLKQSTRLYILKKDIKERLLTLIYIIFLYGTSLSVFSFISFLDADNEIDALILMLFSVGGALSILGGIATVLTGRKDYRNWKSHILSEPTEIVADQSQTDQHSEHVDLSDAA